MDSEPLKNETEREKNIIEMVDIIRVLLAKNLIDKDKLTEKEYVFQVIKTNQEIFDEVNILLRLHDDFVESAREALAVNRPEVAVVLIATAIEQITNLFYREVLEEDRRFTQDEITEIIRTTNINAKISWLLGLVADFVLDVLPEDSLQKDILKLMELRNQIVHYKAVPLLISKGQPSEFPIKQRIREYGYEKMLEIPNQLSESLDVALHNFRVNDPEYLALWKAVESFT